MINIYFTEDNVIYVKIPEYLDSRDVHHIIYHKLKHPCKLLLLNKTLEHMIYLDIDYHLTYVFYLLNIKKQNTLNIFDLLSFVNIPTYYINYKIFVYNMIF